ncbi:hypothetical protein [Halochromatium roseum]|uniref:hypothetical protein n=1 Tax=Halochromatium roseum TaxID=391920 RepID=UPI001F5C85C0|nr:hypothetical protein [Halochromatium roseum]
MMKDAVTLDEAIDVVLHLPSDQQEMLIDILRHRQIDGRREEIAEDAQQMKALLYRGQLEPQSAREVIADLHEGLENDQ